MIVREIEIPFEDEDLLVCVTATVSFEVVEEGPTWDTPAIEERSVAGVCVTRVVEVGESHRRVLDRRESPMEALGAYEERVMLAIHENPELIGGQ